MRNTKRSIVRPLQKGGSQPRIVSRWVLSRIMSTAVTEVATHAQAILSLFQVSFKQLEKRMAVESAPRSIPTYLHRSNAAFRLPTLRCLSSHESNLLAAFTEKEIEDQWPVWQLFQNGGVVLFNQQAILDDAADNLTLNGYQVHNIECQHHTYEEAVLFAVVDSLKIPRSENIGLDGFNDFMSQIDFDGCMGVVVVLTAFHQFRQASPECAFHILDIMADNHRSHMLLGNRLITLVQSDDPRIDEQIGTIGGYKPIWNPAEWMNKNRGL